MPRWIQRNGELIPAEQIEAQPRADYYVRGDLPEYRSPINGAVVRGRVQRREDLKRNNCVEVGPRDLKR